MLKIDNNKIGKMVIDGSVISKIVTDGFVVYSTSQPHSDPNIKFIVDNGIAVMFARDDTNSINLYDGNELKTTYYLE